MSLKVNATALSQAFAVAATQTDDATVKVLDDGTWDLLGMSPDRTTMTEVKVLPGAISGDGSRIPESFGVVLGDWIKALKGSDTSELEFSDGRVHITTDGLGTTLPLYPPEDSRALPSLVYESQVIMDVDPIKRLISVTDPKKAMAYIFEVTADGVTITSHDETGLGNDLVIPADDCLILEGTARAGFGWMKWAEIAKAMPRGMTIQMDLRTDFPMKVTFGGDGLWEAVWIAAPWIEEGA